MNGTGTTPLEPQPMGKLQRILAYFQRWGAIRDQPSAFESAAMSVLCIAVCFLLWYLLTAGKVEDRIINPITLPSLTDTVHSFPQLWFERAMTRSALVSLGRVLGGFVLAAAISIPLGICAGAFFRLNAFLRPLSIFGRNIPVAALIPLTLIWFGLGELQKVMFIFLASVAFILFDSTRAVEDVPDSYIDAARTLGVSFVPRRGAVWAGVAGLMYAAAFGAAFYMLARRPGPADVELLSAWRMRFIEVVGLGWVLGFLLWFPVLAYQAVQKVLMPLAMPDIVNSLRLLFGLAFGYIMLAEVINAEFGLGALIILSQRRGPHEHIYLVLLMIAILAFGIDRGVLTVQRWLFPYRRIGAQ
ncbi:MAG: ABC transporter permease subunit [Candidatus Hydrogenedentes bacterium]|nr:ABC transporter permease subunit [Candidatus Hydrogenedentota bacterium]